MEEVASTAKLVDAGAVDAQSGLTATLPRSDVEAALQDEAGADLFLEIARIQNGERNDRTIKVAWDAVGSAGAAQARAATRSPSCSTRPSSSGCSTIRTSRHRACARRLS